MSILDTIPPSAIGVSNSIIQYEHSQGRDINLHKLSHMLYLIQGFSLAIYDKVAFYESIISNEKVSVVIPPVIQAFQRYGNDNITKRHCNGSEIATYMWLRDEMNQQDPDVLSPMKPVQSKLTAEQESIIKQVCEHVKNMSSVQIAEYNIKNEFSAMKTSVDGIISLKDLKQEFVSRLQHLKEKQNKRRQALAEEKVVSLRDFKI